MSSRQQGRPNQRVNLGVNNGSAMLPISKSNRSRIPQYAIVKADDMAHNWANPSALDPCWTDFLNLAEKKGIRISIGIIGCFLVSGSRQYHDKLIEIYNRGNVEFWNHGYTHKLSGTDSSGQLYHEFYNRPYWEQRRNLEFTNVLARACLGIELTAFGAPGNAYDDVTVDIMDDVEETCVWIFGSLKSSRFVIPWFLAAEAPLGHPNFDNFRSSYRQDMQPVVLQVQPGAWTSDGFVEFGRIVDFLLTEGAQFVTPTEYAKIRGFRRP